MSFLRWICENSRARKRGEKGNKKTINQYWRDFKMLYLRGNGEPVNGNVAAEVIKV